MAGKERMMRAAIPELVESYLSYKHQLGFQMTAESVYLRQFARYTQEVKYDGPLSRDIALQWCESGDNPSYITKGRRFEPLKGLSDYALAFSKESEILPSLPYGNPHKRIPPHIYTLEETLLLMDRCSLLHSPDGIRSLTVRTAIGLMWATGIRTSEAVGLTVPDVDIRNNLIFIRSSKFNKDRVLPIREDVSGNLALYRRQVESILPDAPKCPEFFLNTGGAPFNRRAFEYAFQKIRDVIDVSDSGYDHARLYDFRHTFATRTIRTWLKNGKDVNAKLFLLSTYMGHSHPEDTYWYISSTPELLSISANNYEEMFGGAADYE